MNVLTVRLMVASVARVRPLIPVQFWAGVAFLAEMEKHPASLVGRGGGAQVGQQHPVGLDFAGCQDFLLNLAGALGGQRAQLWNV